MKMSLYIDRWVSAGLLAQIYPSSLFQSPELGWSAVVRVQVILKKVFKKNKTTSYVIMGLFIYSF